MSSPTFSIVIPVYNQAEFLGNAIQSSLDQTFPDHEIIVVNDASTDNTEDIVRRYSDVRIRYIAHSKNRGLSAARNTGILAAQGEFIALLDGDDFFHPDKLKRHDEFYNKHADIDVTYNSRFELHHSAETIRRIYHPPAEILLTNFLTGFPFSPSDMIIRKACFESAGLFDEQYKCGGEDLDFPLRLILNGKQFARVDGILNYRRFHSRRKKKNLLCRVSDYTRALEHAFCDSRIPEDCFKIRRQSFAQHYSEVACWAFIQEEYSLGNDLLEEIQIHDPDFFSGNPARFVKQLLKQSIRDINLNHEQILKRIFANLSPKFNCLNQQLDWAISTGYLFIGTQEIIWGRCSNGLDAFAKAIHGKAIIDKNFLDQLIADLLIIDHEFGPATALKAIENLHDPIKVCGGKQSIHYLIGNFAFNRAFLSLKIRDYSDVYKQLLRAVRCYPKLLLNRGFHSLMLKALRGLFSKISRISL